MSTYETIHLKRLARIVDNCAAGMLFDSFLARNALDQLKALAYFQGSAAVTAAFDNASKYSTMDPADKDQFAAQLTDLIDLKDSIDYLSMMLKRIKQIHDNAGETANLALASIVGATSEEASGYPIYDALKTEFLEGCRSVITSANAERRYLEDIASKILAIKPADSSNAPLLILEKPEPPAHLYSGPTSPELEQLGPYYSKIVAALRNDMPRVTCQRWRLHPVVVAWGAENRWHVRIGFANRTGELRSDNYINIPPPWITQQDVADIKDCTESREGHFMSSVSMVDWQYVDHRKYDAYEQSLSLEVLAQNINYHRLVPNRDFVDGILNDPEFGRAVSNLSWRLLDKEEHGVTLERTESGDEIYSFMDEFRQEFAITSPADSTTWELSMDGRIVRTFPPGSERHEDVRMAVLDLAELSAIREAREQARRM